MLATLLFGGLVNSVLASPHEHPEDFLTVQATDPLAAEPGGQPGTFTLVRAGKTNEELTAQFTLAGTASNGVDYAAIPLSVTFAPGQLSSNLSIAPIAEPHRDRRYKTVVLKTFPAARHEFSRWFVGSLHGLYCLWLHQRAAFGEDRFPDEFFLVPFDAQHRACRERIRFQWLVEHRQLFRQRSAGRA